jgi:hypothetical protein
MQDRQGWQEGMNESFTHRLGIAVRPCTRMLLRARATMVRACVHTFASAQQTVAGKKAPMKISATSFSYRKWLRKLCPYLHAQHLQYTTHSATVSSNSEIAGPWSTHQKSHTLLIKKSSPQAKATTARGTAQLRGVRNANTKQLDGAGTHAHRALPLPHIYITVTSNK